MSSASHLTPVAVVFAAGTAGQNAALPELFAALHPALPLYVVSEFPPPRGEWIPWHVLRSAAHNRAAIRAALRGHRIQRAALALAQGTAYGPLRLAALRLAGSALGCYDETLRPVSRAALPFWFARQAAPVEGGRAHKWLRRLAHPAESEIPLRARLAQTRGLAANHLRGQGKETPLRGQPETSDGITVVIPTRDGRELLAAMLPPLVAQMMPEAEILVVDNGSGDGTAEWLAKEYPAIRVLPFPAPLSFARAVNAGVAQARYSRTLLLNNDMLVESGFLAALGDAFGQVPHLFCATAQIFFPPGARREETGKAVWRRESALDFPMRCDDPQADEDLTWVFYGSGGCSLYDTEKLREMGGVAEIYEPAYVEDMDLGYRAWKRGWPSVYCAKARAEHRHRATTTRFYAARQLDYFVERNYLRFLSHAVSEAPLFEKLWLEAIRRLQLLAMQGSGPALDALRSVPRIGPRPPAASGVLSESEIFALGNGDIACFPGRARHAGPVILIASPYLPYPLSHGGAVRIYNLMKQAARDHDLVLVAFCDEAGAPPAEVLDLCREVVLARRHGTHYRRETTRPDTVEEFDSESFRACLKQTANRWKPAVVQLEFTWMAQFADACPAAKTILVEHDVTFDLQEQLLRGSTETGVARWELEEQAQKWRSFETRVWREVDCVVTMSARDELQVTQHLNGGPTIAATLPNGVDCERFRPPGAEPEAGRLLFIGSFAHLPNLLALEFFLQRVWPLLEGRFRLHVIAGANPEYYLQFHRHRVAVNLRQPGIDLEGFVADVREAYGRAELVLAPLTASAGTNIKVLEAMAMGRVVVSTPAGINGLNLRAGEDVVVTAAPEEMAAAIRELAATPERRRALERQARETALGYDWSAIGARQSELYRRFTR